MIKSVAEMTSPETCACGSLAVRDFVPTRIHLIGTAVQNPEYNPGLGCVVNNKQHRAELCKQKGLEEIGTESPAKLHKHFDERRAEKLESAYEQADRGWVGDGSS